MLCSPQLAFTSSASMTQAQHSKFSSVNDSGAGTVSDSWSEHAQITSLTSCPDHHLCWNNVLAAVMAWMENENVKLIKLWGEDNVQAQLKSCTRHASTCSFQRLATEMQAADYYRKVVSVPRQDKETSS